MSGDPSELQQSGLNAEVQLKTEKNVKNSLSNLRLIYFSILSEKQQKLLINCLFGFKCVSQLLGQKAHTVQQPETQVKVYLSG